MLNNKVYSAVSTAEYNVLKNWYYSITPVGSLASQDQTNGDILLSRWKFDDPSSDPCEDNWLYITCDSSNSHIERLVIAYKSHLSATLNGLEGLTFLKELTLTGWQSGLTGPIPSGFGNLQHLEVLNLFGNNFSGNLPASLGNLSNLVELIITGHGDPLGGAIPTSWSNLNNLKELRLTSVNVNSVLSEDLFPENGWASLEKIDCDRCNIQGALPSSIANLKNLKKLMLSRNSITSIPDVFDQMISLTHINLDDNQIAVDFPHSLASAPQLQSILLQNNQITGTLPCKIATLESLVYLAVTNNKISGEIPNGFSSLPNLAGIYLNDNEFTGFLPADIDDRSWKPDWNGPKCMIQNNPLSGYPANVADGYTSTFCMVDSSRAGSAIGFGDYCNESEAEIVSTNPCDNENPCLNDGICRYNVNNDKQRCECTLKWYGKTCALPAKEIKKINYLHHLDNF